MTIPAVGTPEAAGIPVAGILAEETPAGVIPVGVAMLVEEGTRAAGAGISKAVHT